MNNNFSTQLALWHKFVETQNVEILNELLAEDVKFHSPFVWKPKEGKQMAAAILSTAAKVFEEFRYIREVVNDNNWALEFEAKIGGLSLHGIDLMSIDSEGKIIDFEVMVRPANGLQALAAEMGKRLNLI